MNTQLIAEIFEICVIPLLAILTRYAVKFFQAKADELTQKADNELTAKYTQLITDTITECVIATNQTYVDSLKKQGKFDAEAQKKAFEETYVAVMDILSEDVKTYINETTGDLQTYLIKKIESTVNANKLQ
ncbi:MAG: hypothetical protein NC218_09315 [Acetobacter sp.]|nr:hypothetical protein [Acetobacter sp.]